MFTLVCLVYYMRNEGGVSERGVGETYVYDDVTYVYDDVTCLVHAE